MQIKFLHIMRQSITIPKDWQSIIWNLTTQYDRVDDKFLLLDSNEATPLFGQNSEPFALDNMMVLIFCTQGEAHFRLDMREYKLKAPFMATIRNKKIGDVHFVSDDYKAIYYCLSADFANKLFYQLQDTYEFNRCMRERPAFSIDNDVLENILANKNLIRAAMSQLENEHRIEAVRCLIQSLYFTYKKRFFTPQARNIQVGGHAETIVNRFLNLVRDNYLHERELNFYASKLCMTPKYLSRVVKQVTGKTAYVWITDAVIQQAKMMLKCTDKTIMEIGNEMNFSSQVFFSKYFKNATGMSPREYRQQSVVN